MLHGMLLDEYSEFFISTQPTTSSNEDVDAREIEQQAQIESSVVIRGITGRELDKMRVSRSTLYVRIPSSLSSYTLL